MRTHTHARRPRDAYREVVAGVEADHAALALHSLGHEQVVVLDRTHLRTLSVQYHE